MIEEDRPEPIPKGGLDVSPHVLVAAEPVSENHYAVADSVKTNVVAFYD